VKFEIGDVVVLDAPLFCKECVCQTTIDTGQTVTIAHQVSKKRVLVRTTEGHYHKVRMSRIRGSARPFQLARLLNSTEELP